MHNFKSKFFTGVAAIGILGILMSCMGIYYTNYPLIALGIDLLDLSIFLSILNMLRIPGSYKFQMPIPGSTAGILYPLLIGLILILVAINPFNTRILICIIQDISNTKSI